MRDWRQLVPLVIAFCNAPIVCATLECCLVLPLADLVLVVLACNWFTLSQHSEGPACNLTIYTAVCLALRYARN